MEKILLDTQTGYLKPPMGQDEQSVVALKNVTFKAFAGALCKSFSCDDFHNRSCYRDNDQERLERS